MTSATQPPHYGCHNRAPYADRVLLGPELLMECGEVIEINRSYPHVMTKDCVYTTSALGQADKKCHGCKWRKVAA